MTSLPASTTVLVDGQGADGPDRAQAVSGWRARRGWLKEGREEQGPGTLVDIFMATAERWRRRLALEDQDRRLTYGQLQRRAVHLACQLANKGVGPGDRVGVRVPGGTADLYIAVLGVLMAGAAYVPVDCADPIERAELLWQEAGVSVTVGEGLEVSRRGAELKGRRARRRGPEPGDECWVIFTSGSTGHPKGVAVTHRSAVAFIEAEAELWSVSEADRVLAGLSVSFDASCEEIWLAWRNGAALVAAPRDLVRSGADLGPWLCQRAVTVVSTVPSLASLWDEAHLGTVRLLVLGGETCPTRLGWRLAAGREVWNTYGPTEATVVSTAGLVLPGRPVTIGYPLQGWRVAVVDEEGALVRPGQPGEVVIAGAGLARYLDPSLDAARYAPLPALGWRRAFRTGDMARSTKDGLEFLGRRDDQVKIGGRRVELGEVDAQLASVPGVQAAAAALRATASGHSVLVGYVVGQVSAAAVRETLAQRLPEALVPRVVRLGSLPLKPSGKVDRAALPWPPPDEPAGPQEPVTLSTEGPRLSEEGPRPPSTSRPGEVGPVPSAPLREGEAACELEGWLAKLWVDQLGAVALDASSDFFDLGGTSLAAARLVSALRQRFPSVAVADVYMHRKLADMAAHLRDQAASIRTRTGATAGAGRWGTARLAGALAITTVSALQWSFGALAYNQWAGPSAGLQIGWVWVVAGWLLVSSAPGRGLLVATARALLLRDLRPGRYSRHSWLATRVWFVARLSDVLDVDQLGGTPWTARYGRLFGARVGHGVRLGTLPSPSGLVRVGDGATVEADVDLNGWWLEEDELVVGEVTIGAGARVGARCSLMPGAHVGAGAEVEPGSVVSGFVPPGERWSGSPARRVGLAGEGWPAAPPPPALRARRAAVKARFMAGMVVTAGLPLVAAVPELAILWELDGRHVDLSSSIGSLAAELPLFTLCYLVAYALVAALLVRFAFLLVKPGWQRDDGACAWALWFTGSVMAGTRALLFPLYASLLTRPWLRLAGVRVGRRTEVSLAIGLNRLTTLGETSFLADDVLFAGARGRQGWLDVTPIEVGSRTFLGNGAILRPGTTLGDDCLVGVLSSPPESSPHGTSWLGLPALELPRAPDLPDPSRTVAPPPRLVAGRATMEALRILVPGTVSALLGLLVFAGLELAGRDGGLPAMFVAGPLVLVAAGAVATAFTVAVKWGLMGRYGRGEHPLWSFFVWRDEIVNTCQEQLSGAWLLAPALGTPFMAAYLRAMGARIGKGVYFETLAVTEFDLVTVGDGCAVNRGACVETHLFHDRLMRIGPSVLGPGSTLGPNSAVLPDTKLEEGCSVGPRSVVLRGEQLPAGTRWLGAPVSPA